MFFSYSTTKYCDQTFTWLPQIKKKALSADAAAKTFNREEKQQQSVDAESAFYGSFDRLEQPWAHEEFHVVLLNFPLFFLSSTNHSLPWCSNW